MKKIMFNDRFGLTDAVLNGSKTQTRRVVAPFAQELIKYCISKGYMLGFKDGFLTAYDSWHKLMADDFKQPYMVGEVVAVAQSYEDVFYKERRSLPVDDPAMSGAGLNNKMFVKADLMPHQIRITGVRIERLQDISEEDCLKEGIKHKPKIGTYSFMSYEDVFLFGDARSAYAALIDKVSGKRAWDSNPFVWVYDFELVK